MSVFKTVDYSESKPSYSISIKNIGMANDHWGNEKSMVQFLDEVENFTYDMDTFDRNILRHALTIKKYIIRLTNIQFFRIPAENKLILLASTRVPPFKEVEPFTREMSITFPSGLTFSIIELLEEEEKKMKESSGKITYPESWIQDEYLTDRFHILKEIVS